MQKGYFVGGSLIVTDCAVLCLCAAAEDGKDHYVEVSEVTACETRADESFLLQKPVTRAKLEARTNSLQVPRLLFIAIILHHSYFVTSTSCPVFSNPASNIQRWNVIASGKESCWILWAVFPRWEKTYWLHPGLQEVQSTGGKEVHFWEEFTSWGFNAGERGKIILVWLKLRLYLDSLTWISSSCVLFLNLKALLDKQRHHVCEGPCSMGYTLQICRADEHPNAFQVTVREKKGNSVFTTAFSVAANHLVFL